MKKCILLSLVLGMLWACGRPKGETVEVIGQYHRVMPKVEILLPNGFIYFNLEDNKQRIKEKTNDATLFKWFDQMSNSYHGAKMFLDTISLSNSVMFYSTGVHVPLTKENVRDMISTIEKGVYSFRGEVVREESSLIRIGDKSIFKLKYKFPSDNRYAIYYVISTSLKTVGMNVLTNDDDLYHYVKNIKL